MFTSRGTNKTAGGHATPTRDDVHGVHDDVHADAHQPRLPRPPAPPPSAHQNGSLRSLISSFNSAKIDTSNVDVDDDDQLPPKVELGSPQEALLLKEMESHLDAKSATAPKEYKLMSLRGRKYDPERRGT